jgi:hydroxypyruvate isomerase
VRISANLGLLWTHLDLPDAIAAAAAAGFDAVECHWPYAIPAADLRAVLDRAGMELLSLNTAPGGAGEFGLTALPGREHEARAAFDTALAYAVQARVPMIHVMAGISTAPEALDVFANTLECCCRAAAAHGITLLIEPINRHDVPGYALSDPDVAVRLITGLGAPNLRIMADCYHLARMGHDVPAMLAGLGKLIGHVQIAGVPDRNEPDRGTLDPAAVLAALARVGYRGAIGAEYRPSDPQAPDLRWLGALRRAD